VSDQTNYERGAVQGPGGADQLPYGAAEQLNQAAAATPPPEPAPTAEAAPEATPQEVPAPEQTLPAEAPPEPFAPGAGSTGLSPDEEKYLFSPTERPNEVPTTMRMIDPKDIADWMPDLAAEAARPDAEPQLKAIFKAAVLGPEG
jgi:hypothetical protein